MTMQWWRRSGAGGVALLLALPLAAASGGSSRAHSVVPGVGLRAVACASSSSCIAVGFDSAGNGLAVVVAPSSATAKRGRGRLRGSSLGSVACPTRTVCLASAGGTIAKIAASNGKVTVSGKLRQPKTGTAMAGAVACPSSKLCYAVGSEGGEETSVGLIAELSPAGRILRTVTVKSSSAVGAIACSSSSVCLVGVVHAGAAVEVATLKEGKLGRGHPVSVTRYLEALACYRTEICYALEGSRTGHKANVLVALDATSGAARASVRLPSAFNGTALACTSGRRCVVVGEEGVGSSEHSGAIVVRGRTAGRFVRLAGALSGVACASASRCTAVGVPARTFGGEVDRIAL